MLQVEKRIEMAPTGNAGAPHPDPNVVAPLIFGVLVLYILFGLLSVQVYLYHLAFPRDIVLMKFIVYGTYLVLLTQAGFVAYDTYTWNILQQTGVGFGWLFVPVVGGIVGFIVQAFYAWRIYMLSERRVGAILLALIAFLSNVSALVSGGFGAQSTNLTDLNASVNRAVRITSTIWYTGSAVCDVLIAWYMIYLLTRNGGGMGGTRVLVRKIVRLTVETNSLTAGVAVLTTVLLLALPGKTYFTAPSLILPSLYANTLLIMLNLRFRVSQLQSPESTDLSMSSLTLSTPSVQSGCVHCNRRSMMQSHYIPKPMKTDLERGTVSFDRDERTEDTTLRPPSETGVAY
ncbi:hypothetical protein Moror_2416 [Moniliophthora roreri MCA 2997]|uniref:DUF6534 domain-containing protein n=2 Tax=Moniliophthora roreri TaxID=221103 RepID=V2WG40_MONRO|nr:hypothetical protein Moror_2416 [Moniliophthora roreri MCA 2997]KAI3605680.1 hypothetical protein WG66_011977 [Moniliophthora roreri]